MSQNLDAASSTSGELLSKKRTKITEEEEDLNRPQKFIKFDQIVNIFQHYTTISEFCISGELEFNEKISKIFYKSNDTTHWIDMLNISDSEIDTLINNCSLSPFGMGTHSMIDLTVREAKELRSSDFAFQFNPNMNSTMTSLIKKLLSDRDFLIEPYKLNIYSKGGHFKKHKDTLKNEKMIASLVVCLPIPFEGGILTVENEKGQYVDFDWGKQITDSWCKRIHWACFFCSCDHSISKVTKGNRITISYDIFKEKEEEKDANNEESNIPEKYRIECRKYLEHFINGLDVNESYGYFPNHVYSFSDTEVDDESEETGPILRNNLKGNDLLLYDILNQHGWEVILQVYYPDLASYGPVVPFDTNSDGEYYHMEQAVAESDRRKLSALSSLKLLNSENKCKEHEIYDYEYYGGYTGNSPVRQYKTFYAGTIMVLKYQNKSAELSA